MAESHELGQTGEDMAVRYLKDKGYKILERNWKTGRHEIDIIAENREFIAFTEVKTRSEDYWVEPKEDVTKKKQQSIIIAADTYLKRHNIDKEGRFDIITVIKKGNEYQIEHTESAYYPTLR